MLSIVAGARIETITGMLATRDCRASDAQHAGPNWPGHDGLDRPTSLNESQRKQAQTVFGSFGEEVYVDDERYLDMATALSGTGPAYVFIFMEAMVDAGVHLGFSRYLAEKLVYQTVPAASNMRGNPANTWPRCGIRSPRRAARAPKPLYQIEKGGLRTVMSRAIWAAYQKSRKLGRGIVED